MTPYLFLRVLTRLVLGKQRWDDLVARGILHPYLRSRPFLPPRIVELRWLGMRAYVRSLEDERLLSPGWEEGVGRVFRPRSGEVVIDVGANIGRYTLLASKLVGSSGRVIALEPESENFRVLSINIQLNGLRNVTALPWAAADADGDVRLYLDPYPGSHSLVSSKARPKSVRVQRRRLDALAVEHVHWIKIDVEGAEAAVLRGSKAILHKHRPKLIVECMHDPSTAEVRAILAPLGYRVRVIQDTTPLGFRVSPLPGKLPPYIFGEPM